MTRAPAICSRGAEPSHPAHGKILQGVLKTLHGPIQPCPGYCHAVGSGPDQDGLLLILPSHLHPACLDQVRNEPPFPHTSELGLGCFLPSLYPPPHLPCIQIGAALPCTPPHPTPVHLNGGHSTLPLVYLEQCWDAPHPSLYLDQGCSLAPLSLHIWIRAAPPYPLPSMSGL